MVLFLDLSVTKGQSQTLYSRKSSTAIKSVNGPPKVSQYGVEEISIDADGTYDNPFDPADVSLDCTVKGPKGESYVMPGFLSRDFTRQLKDGKEQLMPNSRPNWKVRLQPTQQGSYAVHIVFKDRTQSKEAEFSFSVIAPTGHGSIARAPRDAHYFEYSDGVPYFPVGQNLCWSGPRGTFDYDLWVQKLGEAGANEVRLWLGPTWCTFPVLENGDGKDGLGSNMIDLESMWKLDHVLELDRHYGIACELCLDTKEELEIRESKPDWKNNPLNRDNGGPLRIWSDFWTNQTAAAIYQSKLRYFVARYAADQGLFAWELWNDVDQVPEYDADVVRAWHRKVGETLKKLDPYHHLVTTSYSQPQLDRDTFALAQLDFDQVHLYSPQLVGPLANLDERRLELGKPILTSEVAASHEKSFDQEDPSGLQFHDAMWISVVTGASGTAEPWFWDSYVDVKNLYGLYRPISSYIAGIRFPDENFRVAPISATSTGCNVWSLAGDDVVLAWILPKGHDWKAVVLDRVPDPIQPASTATFTDLAKGAWVIEYWDTWNGKPLSTQFLSVGLDGTATLHIPAFSKDLAVKLRLKKSA